MRVAILTISEACSRGGRADTSGDTIASWVAARGVTLAARKLIPDENVEIVRALTAWCDDDEADLVITTGGTGISGRDTTYEVVERMIEKKLDGFGEIFRMLSYEEIGAAAIMSRAIAGAVGTKFVASLPGSRNAVRLAVEKLLVPELAHIVFELRKHQESE